MVHIFQNLSDPTLQLVLLPPLKKLNVLPETAASPGG